MTDLLQLAARIAAYDQLLADPETACAPVGSLIDYERSLLVEELNQRSVVLPSLPEPRRIRIGRRRTRKATSGG